MRLRRDAPTGPPPPMPDHLVGVGIVEEWVGHRELLPPAVGPAPRPGESDVAAAYRREAERRLDEAREEWQRDQRAFAVDHVDLLEVRPELDERASSVAQEIIEQRRWTVSPARCEWRDLAAFERGRR